MKLASLKSGRDGRLVVVSDDLAWCADAGHIAPTLQAALDGWTWIEPALCNLSTDLAHGTIPKERFHERAAASPLPRAYQFLAGDPAAPCGDLITQGGADAFLGPRDSLSTVDSDGIEAGVVVITGDVPAGCAVDQAGGLIRLTGLVSRTAPGVYAFSPVFVTPDGLGDDWAGGKLGGALTVELNGAAPRQVEIAAAMPVDFGQLVARAAKSRPLSAGTIVSGGPAYTSQVAPETVRIWMDDAKHHPIFGVIEQGVKPAHPEGA